MQNNNTKTVLDLFISIKSETTRSNKQQITIDTNGIIGDKFYGKNQQRSILITSLSSYKLALENGIDVPYGNLGENILIDLDIYHLKPKHKLQIGTTVLEITQNCTICNSLSKVDKKLPKLLEHSRGIFAKMISGSVIKKGDTVSILD
jgi:MOSC domain-containing protein YiiM